MRPISIHRRLTYGRTLPSLFTNRTLEADLRYPISDVVPILGQLVGPSFPRQFVTEKESVTVYLTDRSIARCRQSERGPLESCSPAPSRDPHRSLFSLSCERPLFPLV